MDEDENPRQGIPNDWYALWLGDEPLVVEQVVQADQALVDSQELGLHLVGRRHPSPGKKEQEFTHRAVQLIDLLTKLGIQVNREKSMTQPSQKVEYLGHHINLKDHRMEPTRDKTTQLLVTTKKLLRGKKFQPKQLASLAGG